MIILPMEVIFVILIKYPITRNTHSITNNTNCVQQLYYHNTFTDIIKNIK